MADAMVVMGIDGTAKSDSSTRAFARDLLRVEIEGPSRPQLKLADLPGTIENDTKGAIKEDVKLVKATNASLRLSAAYDLPGCGRRRHQRLRQLRDSNEGEGG